MSATATPDHSHPRTHRGACMCGAVRLTLTGTLRDVWNCHCQRCRRWTGHHMAATRCNVEDVQTEGEVRWFTPTDHEPSEVEYGFCPTCGSSLMWRADSRPEFVSVCAGVLDQPTGLRTTTVWWRAEHADYHEPATGLEEHLYDG